MGILSFLGFGDDEEEKTTAVAPGAAPGNVPIAPTGNAAILAKINAPSNMAGGRRRKTKHRKGRKGSKRHSRRH